MLKLTRFFKPFNNYLQLSAFRMNELDHLFKTKYALTQNKDEEQPKNINTTDKPTEKIKPKKQKHAKKGKEQQENKQIKFEIKTPKGTRDYLPNQMAIRRMVIDRVAQTFKKHGAVEIDTPVFELKDVLTNKYGEDSKLIYDLQDQGGQLCSLRYDLTVPFARFMAMNTNIQKIKRFHIGKVYRRDQPTINKGRFRQFYQCDFDIAGSYDSMIPDAQVLCIMQQILEDLGIDNYIVKVNHRKILEAMIREAHCDPELFKAICSSIDKLDKLPWKQVQQELIKAKGVKEDQAQILGKLTKNKGHPFQLLNQIQEGRIFKQTLKSIDEQLIEMNKLFRYLQAMERIDKVSFDLSLARGLDYYTGLIFEIVLTDKKCELGSISGGGRYDNLIGMFSQHQIPSVGGSLGIERLFTILEKQYQGKVKQNESQILVATIGKIPVQQKLKILNKLWRSNIKAQTLYVQKSKTDKYFSHAFSHKIPMILWVGENQLKSGQLSLKITYKNQQVKVNLENLGESVMPYILEFRKDFELGKINLEQEPTHKN